MAADFRLVWERVRALEGETVGGATGGFRYRLRKTFVVIEPGGQSIPRTCFEKVHKRMESGEIETAPPVQGQKSILAIYRDPRIGR